MGLCSFKKGKYNLKKLLLLMIFTLSMVICCAVGASAAEYDTLKVGLYYGSTAQNSININVDSAISYGYYDGEVHIEMGQLELTDLTFRACGENQVIINEVQVVIGENANISIVPLEGNIKINGKEYRGSVLLTNVTGSSMNVLNLISLEEYLYGVVPNEVPAKWHEEALKTQAVCARGFAVSNFNKHASLGFNVCATTNCQVYGGVSNEHEATTKAVDDTRGQVVFYEGEPIESLFYSSSGGHTANAKNVWGSSISYLSGVPDPYEPEDSPRHSWSATLTLEEIEDALAARNINVGAVTELVCLNDETGRAYELTIKGTEGTHTLTKTSTNSPFVSHGVISQKFTVIPITTGGKQLYAVSSKGTKSIGGYSVIYGNGKTKTIDSAFYMQTPYGPEPYVGGGDITGYTFSGGGWGHGVGMSQYGSMGMANAGFTYEEILAHYYPGTELGELYQ